MTMHHFLAKNGPIVPNELFSENYFYHSHLAISPFHCAKLKKNLPVDPELLGCAIFGPKMTHFLK